MPPLHPFVGVHPADMPGPVTLPGWCVHGVVRKCALLAEGLKGKGLSSRRGEKGSERGETVRKRLFHGLYPRV